MEALVGYLMALCDVKEETERNDGAAALLDLMWTC